MISRSSAKTDSSQTSSTSVQNLNLQDTAGVTLANSNNNHITLTDDGAVSAAHDIGVEALRMGSDTVDASLDFAGRATETVARSNENALSFGRDAIAEIADFGGAAIGEVSRANKSVLDFASDLYHESVVAQENLTQNNLSGLTALAQQTSSSADDRVGKVAGYAFLAIAAVFVLPALLKGNA